MMSFIYLILGLFLPTVPQRLKHTVCTCPKTHIKDFYVCMYVNV